MYNESRFNSNVNLSGKNIIYNSLSKASVEITDPNTIQRLIIDGDSESLGVLNELGIVIDGSFDEFHAIKYLFNKNYFGGNRFLNVVLVPSLLCNFKCPYCFEQIGDTYERFPSAPAEFFDVLRKYSINNMMNYDDIEISLFGGEPLVFADQLFDYFMFLDSELPSANYFTSIVTNGALLDVDMARRLLDINCKSMQVTIDGHKDKHDTMRIFKDGRPSFDLLMRNINAVVTVLPGECQFNLRINLNNVSVQEVEDTLEQIVIENRQKIKVLFRPIYNTDSFKQKNSNTFNQLKPFLDIATDKGFDIVRNTYHYQACEACSGDNFYFIMPDMTIWKCINDLNFTDACIGKISNDGELVLDANRLVKWAHHSNCFDDEECRNCKMLPDCFGGCVLNRAKNGIRLCKEFEMACLPYLY